MALCAAAVVLAVAAASAAASSPIEGVWSFNGGEVAIAPAAGGRFTGTVVKTTTFDECPHQAGETIWSDMTEQADGSFWGLHQWFYAGSGCMLNPTLGPTAWRVLSAGTGKVLRVCLSEPGLSQPTIAADGSHASSSFGCVDSALTPTTLEEVCVLSNKLRVRVKVRKDRPLKDIRVVVAGGHKRRVVRFKPRHKSFVAVVKLGKITAPTVRATVKLTTTAGKHFRQRHVYRRCG
jgi:hypothetical protein